MSRPIQQLILLILARKCLAAFAFCPPLGPPQTLRTVVSNGATTEFVWAVCSDVILQQSARNTDAETSRKTLVQRVRSFLASRRGRYTLQSLWKRGKSVLAPVRLNQTSVDATETALDHASSPSAYQTEESTAISQLPQGPRWAIAYPTVDLSGTWKPIITPEFQKEYNRYLINCGTTMLFRQACLRFCGTTREIIEQEASGRILRLHGKNPAGGWKRSLVSSGADSTTDDYEVVTTEFLDPDKERVNVEAWWEEEGRVHKSMLRDKPGVEGGVFETRRYLSKAEDTDRVLLVTESTFHPSQAHLNQASSKFKPAFVRWMYEKE